MTTMSCVAPTVAEFPFSYRELGPRLHKNNWRVIPALPGTKRPAIKNWTRFVGKSPTFEQVLEWAASPVPYGVMLVTGFCRNGVSYGAIDLDEDEPERAAQLLAMTKRILGETPLSRIGRPNRRVLLYALPSRPTPSRRLGPKVELIADRRCVVIHGIHPETRRPYRWEDLGPEDVPARDLL